MRLFVIILGAMQCGAQQSAQSTPSDPQQQKSTFSPAGGVNPETSPAPPLRVSTSVVLVPTLVEKPGGDVVYGLGPSDFIVEDNGIRQKIQVDDDLDSQPVSLVVAVEKGRTSLLQFDKIAKLGPLLELFLGDGHGKAAIVTFDSKPQIAEYFTANSDQLNSDLRSIQPGDGGAAVLDAVALSIDLLEHQPPDHRRILLLISESRDHGSRKVTAQELVQRIGVSNTLVLSLTYSASKAEFLNDLKGNGGGGQTMNLMTPLLMALAAMHKNVTHELASMSGGEYAPFTRERGFEDRVAEVASHARNRYILSFHPQDPTPGLHTLKVSLAQDYGAQVVARTNYWAVSDASTPVPAVH